MWRKLIGLAAAVLGTGILSAQTVHADTTDPQTKANITLTAGNLTLKQAPNIDFGAQKITASGQTYKATTVSPTLKVMNAGQDTDWAVNLQVGTFTSSKHTLKGATLSLSNNTVSPSDSTISQAPTGIAAGAEVTAAASDTGAAVTVLDADRKNLDTTQYSSLGVGNWLSSYSASLDVPAGNVAGDYSADLTWTLSNAPQ